MPILTINNKMKTKPINNKIIKKRMKMLQKKNNQMISINKIKVSNKIN